MPQPIRDVFWPATRNDIYWILWSGSALIALITLTRAASGAYQAGTPGWAFFVAAGGVCINLLLWWWSLSSGASDTARAEIARGTIALCPPLIIGAVLAGGSTVALSGTLSVVAGGLTFVIAVAQRGILDPELRQLSGDADRETGIPAIITSVDTAQTPAGSFDDPTISQQITRRRTGSGEHVEALLRLEFAAKQRETSIHLPIQPAMPGLPHVECEPLDDADIELKVAATHSYGVRIDAKRVGNIDHPATNAVGILISFAVEAAAAA